MTGIIPKLFFLNSLNSNKYKTEKNEKHGNTLLLKGYIRYLEQYMSLLVSS